MEMALDQELFERSRLGDFKAAHALMYRRVRLPDAEDLDREYIRSDKACSSLK